MQEYNDKIVQLRQGLETAFVDGSQVSNLAYKPEFLSNNYKEGRKVLSSLEDELLACDEFCFSVAFITMGGIAPLLQTLKVLEAKNVKGRIITTDYLNFSEPKALKKLAECKNISLKMFCVKDGSEGFHTKGYIFKNEDMYRIVVGSSNMTMSALTKNREWNTKIVSTEQGEYAKHIVDEFEELWNSSAAVDYSKFIESYSIQYNAIKNQRKIAAQAEIPSIEEYTLKPNAMQIGFIENLQKIRERGESRALLISATGTGKTYASAFALRESNTKKALFVVHREQIAKQARRSYKKVFGNTKKFALLSGNSKDFEAVKQADYVFATMQMMAKSEVMEQFAREHFTVCVIDEVHKAGAESYQRIINYFRPELWLGMTASPDRTDGFDIYKLFDHNIAYEIRLQQALEEDMLCPFHYFGITDLEVNGQVFDDSTGLKNFSYLVCEQRVDYVIEQIEYYGYSGNRARGLIFCSRKEEARELSNKFNERGYNTCFLCGEDSQEVRENAISRLEQEEREGGLDYIFTVDIFNEGVDIPAINQVIMLRPTESPIIFIQQLGRGLRKAENKEYVVILDFIGNYNNNFMIPIALSGDRSYNKDNIRRYLMEGGRVIPGASTIHFDEISKKRIFAAIDNANFSDIKLIKENYTHLKNKLGRIPELKDFDDYGELDVLRIFDSNSLGSYYKFLVKYEKEYEIRLTREEEKVIEFVSKKLASGKRIQELRLLKRMLAYANRLRLFAGLREELRVDYGIDMSENQKENIVNIMTNEFPAGASKNTYAECVFIEKDDGVDYHVSESFEKMLANKNFYEIMKELIEFGISRYERDFSNTYNGTDFVLYQKYTYEDVCRLLNWETNEVPLNIGGYKYDKKTKTFPVFINYDKSEDISDTTKYEDHFTSSSSMIAISKSGRSVSSEDVQNFLHAKERGIQVHLFVRKNKDDKISKEFYYLGQMKASGKAREFVMPNTNKTAVEIEWLLDVPVREDLYEYIVNK